MNQNRLIDDLRTATGAVLIDEHTQELPPYPIDQIVKEDMHRLLHDTRPSETPAEHQIAI